MVSDIAVEASKMELQKRSFVCLFDVTSGYFICDSGRAVYVFASGSVGERLVFVGGCIVACRVAAKVFDDGRTFVRLVCFGCHVASVDLDRYCTDRTQP